MWELNSRARKKGMASIVGAMIFFGVIFSVLYTYTNVTRDTNQLVNDAVSGRISRDIDRQNEDFAIRTRNVTSDPKIGFVVENKGQELINVIDVFVQNATGHIADKDDGSKAVFNGSPLFFVAAGTNSSEFNTDVIYPGSGAYTVKVLTDKGNVQSARYPPEVFNVAQVEGFNEAAEAAATNVTITAIGFLLLNQTSLELCRPQSSDCTLESGWTPGWKVTEEEKVEFRVKFKNSGTRDVCFAKQTAYSAIGPVAPDDEAIELEGTNFFIFGGKPTSNDGNSDNPPAYVDYEIRLENNASYVWLYFGARDVGGTTANEFDDLPASEDVLYLLSLVVFAWAVDDGVACSDGPSQGTAYAQTIPFQGLIVGCVGGC